MSKLGREKLDFITEKIGLLSYDYDKNELENIGKILKLNENCSHPEDTRNEVGLINVASNALSFYVKGIYPYKVKLGGGIKLSPNINVINPLKRNAGDFKLLNKNTNDFLKFIRTVYPESISRLAWGQCNSDGKTLKDLYPEITHQNFNFFNDKKSAVLDAISDSYYLAPVNIDMLRYVSSYINDPRFTNICKNDNPDFYIFSLFLKNIFDKKEYELCNPTYESFLKKNVHCNVNITSSAEEKHLLRNVITNYFKNEDINDSLISLIRNNKTNPKYENFRKIDDEMIKEMSNYIDPMRFVYSLEIESEGMGDTKGLNETLIDYKEYKKLDIFTRYFIENLNYVFVLFNYNGATYTYPLAETLDSKLDEDNITHVSVIPIPYNDKTTMFDFFRNLKIRYDTKTDEKIEVKTQNNNFGLNEKGTIKFIEYSKDATPQQILAYYILLSDEYYTDEQNVFKNNVEKQRFVEFILKKLGFKVKMSKIIKYNKEYVKLDVDPKPSISYFKSIIGLKRNGTELTNDLTKLSPLVSFINSFSSPCDKGGGNKITFGENHCPIELYNNLDHNQIREYINNIDDPEINSYNFFTSEGIDFYKDLEHLDNGEGVTVDSVSDIVPLNIYYKKKFANSLSKIIKNSGGKKIYDTISDFLNSIEEPKAGLKQVYNNMGELLQELTSAQDTEQEALIRNVLNSIMTTGSLNTYDLSILKKRIAMIDNYTSNRDDREMGKLLFNLSNFVNRLKALDKKDIKLEIFEDDLCEKLEKIYFQTMSMYQYLNLLEVIRNLFMLLPTYGITITNNNISNNDLKKIDKMFLQKSLYKKNQMIKKRFDDFKKSIGMTGETTFITAIDEIYENSATYDLAREGPIINHDIPS